MDARGRSDAARSATSPAMAIKNLPEQMLRAIRTWTLAAFNITSST
jgi:hypothetical protein